jgi:hypothetical protein
MGVLFMTFTYDPAQWPSRGLDGAEACFRAIGADRHWGEFLRRLEAAYPGFHVFAMLEFHPGEDKEGRQLEHAGWPHFHALLIGPTFFVPFEEIKKLWGWGRIDGSRAGDDAIRYICKYMTKGTTPPAYLDGFLSRVHMTRTSHGFWDILGEDKPERGEPTGVRRAGASTIGEIRACPQKHLRTVMRIIMDTGEYYHRSVKMDISAFVHMMAGKMLGGVDAWDTGHATLVPVPASWGEPASQSVTLDYLLNCGEALKRGTASG